jgi:hypothetical protein
MRIPVEHRDSDRQNVSAPRRRGHARMRVRVLIPKDSPVTQIEIEIVAALLDDWDSLEI